MANTTIQYLKVEIVNFVDHISQFAEGNSDEFGTKMTSDESIYMSTTPSQDGTTRPVFGIRATFAPNYSSSFDVRVKLSADGRICGERLIENSRIHNIEGHIIWYRNNMPDSKKPSRSAWVDSG
ncbi:hypothetical protein SVAN01_10898 [Stagonosporopsis vannaccii]|nr:hypothetical protein SVAN01_10898 [Stagonosporopsis vannaccii]